MKTSNRPAIASEPTTQTSNWWIGLFTLILCFVLPAASSAQLADTKIAFVSNRDGNNEIYVMDADGQNQVNLTNHPESDIYPSWSPDGTKIAFMSARDKLWGGEIYVMDADGKNQVNLTNHPAGDVMPSWSPDGTKIAFALGSDGNLGYNVEIYVMDADGKNPVRLTNHPESDTFPSWSPMLLFLSSKGKLATTWGRIKGDIVP